VCASTQSATVATNRERRAAERCRIQLATAGAAAGRGGSRSSSRKRRRIVVANDGGGDRGRAFVRGREDFVFSERGREKRDEVIGPGVGLDPDLSWAGLWAYTQQPRRHLRSPRPRWVSIFDFLYLLFLLFSFFFLSFILCYYLFIYGHVYPMALVGNKFPMSVLTACPARVSDIRAHAPERPARPRDQLLPPTRRLSDSPADTHAIPHASVSMLLRFQIGSKNTQGSINLLIATGNCIQTTPN
jgi:hypothetical protein